jgi:two-component system response regulator PilR (NtrC family)
MTAARRRVLVVDDEPGLRDMLSIFFGRDGYDVTLAAGFLAAKEALQNATSPYGLVLTDLMMPDGSGLDLLPLVKARWADTEVIVMTAHGALDTAVEAMRRGAYDFITKPFATAELRAIAAKAFEKGQIVAENRRLRAQVEREHPTKDLLGHSEAMRQITDLLRRAASGRSTVLITGESGTGKERIARALHDLSDRAAKPFLVVNCGAIPEALLESELFGHDKGAFTGATSKHLGMFREAEGGTVFLDEIGELPLQMQVKLLRVIQERKVRAVGGSVEIPIDVRILAATNRSVEDDVKAGTFRQDLYYRLNVIRVEVPPLRARKEDIALLAEHFLARCAAEHGKEARGFSADALRALDAHDYPGNVRELENLVERAVALAAGPIIGLGDLPREVSGAAGKPSTSLLDLPPEGLRLDDVLGETERRLILQALERTGGVRTTAARLLGVTLRSFRYRLQKHALGGDDDAVEGDDDRSSQHLPAAPPAGADVGPVGTGEPPSPSSRQ